ncbi:MAG: ATP-binding cassette domain-containing protein [Ignisphaera sp.]|nr:ATP-binding cassette domain-containing protein [Ignisphaera sp.]
MSRPVVEVVGVSKRFGDIVALNNVSLEIYSGEVLVVLGENGSGKSTLAKVLYGIYFPDSGFIRVDGVETVFSSPSDARKHGIFLVSQRPQLIDEMSIAENAALFLGTAASKNLRKKLVDALSNLKISLDVDTPVFRLSYTEKQLVDLAKVLLAQPRLLIVDEAATYLPHEAKKVFLDAIKRLIADGASVMYITHKIGEALEVGDRFVVLRRGSVIGVFNRGIDANMLRQAMFGSSNHIQNSYANSQQVFADSSNSATTLTVKNLTVLNDYGRTAVNNVTFAVSSREVLGIAGVAGNGQKELAETLAGFRKVHRGAVLFNGANITHEPIHRRVRMGFVYIPEDPFREGVALNLTIAENIKLFAAGKGYKVSPSLVIKELGISPDNPLTKAFRLSGGNVQKLTLAKLLVNSPRVVIAHNPTRMLDEKSRIAVLNLLRIVAEKGAAVVFISEDLDEILSISTKVGVMVDGRLTRFFTGNITGYRDEIERAMVYG